MELTIVIIIMLIIVLIMIIMFNMPDCGNKSGFISQQTYDLYNKSKTAFDISSSYTNFKKYVQNTDPVQFMDLYQLYRQDQLSPENIQSIRT